MRGSCASPGCAVPGSNRRAQAIHGLLAPDPRTTASFARWVSVASSIPAPACPAETKIATPRRTSLQGVRVRVVHGCTTPACWSRMRNHAADEIPLQRRPPPEAEAFAGHRNQRRLPRSQGAPALFKLARSGITPSGEEAKKGRDIMSRPWRSHSAGRESASGRYGLTSTLAHSLLRNHLPPVKSGVCAWPGRCLTGAGRAEPAARCSRAWHARD